MIGRLVLLASLVCIGCGDRSRAVDAGIADVRPFAPLTPGDRWRMRTTPPGRMEHLGVTAVDARGRAVMLGTGRTTIDLLDAQPDGVWTVSPDGQRLVPQIVLPLRAGATTRYRVRQGEADGTCTLEVRSLDVHETVAGVRLEGCVRQRRVCRLPAGGGLPRPTTFTDDETRCPGVGLVRDQSTIDPPLPFEGLASRSEIVLVAYHVRGAPVPPAALPLADRLIVLPSDISAVCGGATGPSELRASATVAARTTLAGLSVPSDARSVDTLQAFSFRDGTFLVEARPASSAHLDDYVGASVAAAGGLARSDGPPARIGFAHGDALVRLTPPPSCGLEAASRLSPLIRSMLGPP